jgi:hypothetical protein
MLWLCGTAVAAPPPYYEDRTLKLHLTLHSVDVQSLRLVMGQEMPGRIRGIYRREADGSLSRARVSQLDTPELLASLVALTADIQGAEADLVVQDFEGQLIPVTVWWNDRKEFAVRRGAPLLEEIDASINRVRIQEARGTAPFIDGDRTWDVRSLQIVDNALAALSPDELALFRDVPFHRFKAASDELRQRLGLPPGVAPSAAYIVDEKGPRIEIFDAAIAPPGRFVGTPDSPHPVSYMVILHEVAHAISRAEHRRATLRKLELMARYDAITPQLRADGLALEARVAAYNKNPRRSEQAPIAAAIASMQARSAEHTALVHEIDALALELRTVDVSGMATALAAVLGKAAAPTHYGRTAPEEAFADCFALFHADPDALLRANPAVYEWLASGGHLKVPETAEP